MKKKKEDISIEEKIENIFEALENFEDNHPILFKIILGLIIGVSICVGFCFAIVLIFWLFKVSLILGIVAVVCAVSIFMVFDIY